jgi:hypothetical protein
MNQRGFLQQSVVTMAPVERFLFNPGSVQLLSFKGSSRDTCTTTDCLGKSTYQLLAANARQGETPRPLEIEVSLVLSV